MVLVVEVEVIVTLVANQRPVSVCDRVRGPAVLL